MTTPTRARRVIITLAVAITTLIATTAASGGQEPSVQAQIEAHLRAHPGGTQTSPNEITYYDGAMVVAFSAPGASTGAITPDCAYGTFCLYDSVNYVYPRISFTSCAWRDLYPTYHDWADSIAFNLPAGSVDFINHVGLWHASDVTLFTLSASKRAVFDVKPYRNAIDHVRGTNC